MSPAANSMLDRETARLVQVFATAGAQVVDLPVLQPADTLLDLYGETIRARAYVTRDPVAGELMLRPDFTVPVTQMHLAGGAPPARYAYAGKIFRTQEPGSDRPAEYDQVGYEIFDGKDPAAADAEVFALISSVLAPRGLRAVTGDMGVLIAAIEGLDTTARRKAALRRHIWRPKRFRALLDRFAGRSPAPRGRAELVARFTSGADVLAGTAPLIGLRGEDEIRRRVEALAEDAKAPPISEAEVALIDRIVELRAPMGEALESLRAIAADLPQIAPALDRIEARMGALRARGVMADALEFEGSYGRSTMEYYDGFVFGFVAPDRPGLPPVASGGRYDALTRALAGDAAEPAVGGVIRPALLLEVAP